MCTWLLHLLIPLISRFVPAQNPSEDKGWFSALTAERTQSIAQNVPKYLLGSRERNLEADLNKLGLEERSKRDVGAALQWE